MRPILIGALALFALSSPASAQMCGSGQQAEGKGGKMCGSSSPAAATMEMPSADKPAQKSSDMCPCCKNMAMMKGKPGMQHDMPMETPK